MNAHQRRKWRRSTATVFDVSDMRLGETRSYMKLRDGWTQVGQRFMGVDMASGPDRTVTMKAASDGSWTLS